MKTAKGKLKSLGIVSFSIDRWLLEVLVLSAILRRFLKIPVDSIQFQLWCNSTFCLAGLRDLRLLIFSDAICNFRVWTEFSRAQILPFSRWLTNFMVYNFRNVEFELFNTLTFNRFAQNDGIFNAFVFPRQPRPAFRLAGSSKYSNI